jgi:Ca2+-binding EF-hand superfamily protein
MMNGPRIFSGLRREFRRIDTDSSGYIDLNEFTAVVLSLKLEITEEDIQRLFSIFDVNRDGRIQQYEFLQTMRSPLSEPRLAIV